MPTYLLKTTVRAAGDQNGVQRERLVNAANVAQAIRHVTKDTIVCDIASPADCVRLGKAGVEIEQAGD